MPTGTVVGDDVAAQADQVLRNLVRVTELCGGGLADVVAVRAFLVDWADYEAFNDAYARWFPDRLPSRTFVGTTGLAVGALVEIDWVCWQATAGVSDIQLQGGAFRRRRGVERGGGREVHVDHQ